MDNLHLVTIPKARKQSITNLVTIHGANNKSLPALQLQFTKQSMVSTRKDVTSLKHKAEKKYRTRLRPLTKAEIDLCVRGLPPS